MRKILFLLLAITACSSVFAQKHRAPAPLFRDPVTDGPADPVVFYNYDEEAWWILYTQRRANCEAGHVAFCYGTSIGIAESKNNGSSWIYRGTLDLDFERGMNTFWAPDIIYHKGTYHLFATYVPGAKIDWGGVGTIQHYTSKNGWDWKHKGQVQVGIENIIDASIFIDDEGLWHLWYKRCNESNIYLSTSRDLKKWTTGVPAGVNPPCEAPKVFRFGGYYWMLTDPARGTGLCVYRSDDLRNWKEQGRILTDKSKRRDDGPSACHGDVVVVGDKAYVFYATHPGQMDPAVERQSLDKAGNMPYHRRRSALQCAELILEDGVIKCNRIGFDFFLPNLQKK